MFAREFFFLALILSGSGFGHLQHLQNLPGEGCVLPPMFVLLLLQLNRRQSWKNSKVPLLLSTVTYKELLYRKL